MTNEGLVGVIRKLLAAAGAVVCLALAGASTPSVLSQIRSGVWELSGQRGAPATRLCVAGAQALAQIEHRAARCTGTVLRDDSAVALIDYSCGDSGFGQSKLTMITPRSVRIETQGIADRAPFAYVAHARRVGNCTSH